MWLTSHVQVTRYTASLIMSMKNWWHETKREKTEVLEYKFVPLPLCSTQITYGLAKD
jgi:hypothetical protein